MRFLMKAGLNKIVLFELELTFGGNGSLVELFLDEVIFRISFNISLEVVAIQLFLLGETAKEVGVVFGPSLSLTFQHSLLSTFVVLGINELSSVVFFNIVENAIETADSLFNVPPSLIEILTIRSWKVDSMGSELAINLTESFVHCIEFFVSLLKSLKFVGGVNQDTISLI